MPKPQTLGNFANLVRSKNAGPFWITFDVFFKSDADYESVKEAKILVPATISSLYQTASDDVRVYWLPALLAAKISFPRPTTQGSFTDFDMHAGQHHIPLSGLPIPSRTAATS